jgi:hypothetical protein
MVIDFSVYMQLGWGITARFGQTRRSAPTEIAEYKFYAENEKGCHRGYKPLLHVRRSGDLPALVKTEAGFGLTNLICNQHGVNRY